MKTFMLSILRRYWLILGALVFGGAWLMTFALMTPQVSALSLPTSCNDASNEVIWCGAGTPQQLQNDYNKGDGHNTAGSIQNIYAYFGINQQAINNLSTQAIAGSVTKNGEVLVNGQIVANNAITAGRQYITGSTEITYNGTSFYKRYPSVSFLSNSLDAFVVMVNGRFQYAILSSCGNPVVGVPVAPPAPQPTPVAPTSPNYSVVKQVSASGYGNWTNEISVRPASPVYYQITVSSTGTAPIANLLIKDVLPTDDIYAPGTLSLNGSIVDSNYANNFFTAGIVYGSLSPGSKLVYDFSATAGSNQNNANCASETLPNLAYISANNLPPETATATVSIVCPAPTPPVTTVAVSTPPKQLVNTGPGNIVGIFIVVSLAGFLSYRRLIKQPHDI